MRMVYNKGIVYNYSNKESFKRVSFEEADKMIASGDWVESPVKEIVEAKEPIKKKRVRRTKAQIEADKEKALENGDG